MPDELRLLSDQLARMRAMNGRYHDRFFSDIRFSTVVLIALVVLGLVVDRWLFLAIPIVALAGAAQTAFDASYLIFSRQYATRIEQELNRRVGSDVLVAHRLEHAYLFPLDDRKIVTMPLGGVTWFGFMTAFYTVLGIGWYALGLGLSLTVIEDRSSILYGGVYLAFLAMITLATLGVGVWWFVGGEGERRLATILDQAFPTAG